MKNVIKLITIFFIIFILGIFYLSLNRSPNYNTEYLVGSKLNKIKLENFNNDNFFTNEDLDRDKLTLINFWASWCGPCRAEHPILIELKKINRIKILGVNFKDNRNSALNFLKDLGNPYDYLTKDVHGKQSVNFGIYGIPESILIDENLTILKKYIGPLSIEDFKDIEKIASSL
tara:strand:+ start:1241 stop:1762 length:522 start_codon:yes stop_codon:yes gene_type:complete